MLGAGARVFLLAVFILRSDGNEEICSGNSSYLTTVYIHYMYTTYILLVVYTYDTNNFGSYNI